MLNKKKLALVVVCFSCLFVELEFGEQHRAQRDMRPVTCDLWHVTCDMWPVTCDLWPVCCNLSCDLCPVTRQAGFLARAVWWPQGWAVNTWSASPPTPWGTTRTAWWWRPRLLTPWCCPWWRGAPPPYWPVSLYHPASQALTAGCTAPTGPLSTEKTCSGVYLPLRMPRI